VLEAREVASDVLEAVELALGTPAAPGPEPVLPVPSGRPATVAA
jgi:hypothetical protein